MTKIKLFNSTSTRLKLEQYSKEEIIDYHIRNEYLTGFAILFASILLLVGIFCTVDLASSAIGNNYETQQTYDQTHSKLLSQELCKQNDLGDLVHSYLLNNGKVELLCDQGFIIIN